MSSRLERCQEIRKKTASAWSKEWWAFMSTLNIGHRYYTLSSNINLTEEIINENIDKDWNWHNLSSCPNITLQYVLKNMDKDWIWGYLSENPGIKLEDIKNNPELSWDWHWLSSNININIEFVLKNMDKAWNWPRLSGNPCFKLVDIENNMHLPWNWHFVSGNPNLRIGFILKYPELPWNWDYISCNPGIFLKNIKTYSSLPWKWKHVSANPNINLTFVLENKHLNWCYINLSKNPGINPDDIIKTFNNAGDNPSPSYLTADNHWKRNMLSLNPSLPPDFKCHHPGWVNLYNYAMNSSLPLGMNHDKFSPHCLALNPFTKSKLDFHIQHYRRHLAAFRIQQHWHRIRLDPRHPVGQRRLEREYAALVDSLAG